MSCAAYIYESRGLDATGIGLAGVCFFHMVDACTPVAAIAVLSCMRRIGTEPRPYEELVLILTLNTTIYTYVGPILDQLYQSMVFVAFIMHGCYCGVVCMISGC